MEVIVISIKKYKYQFFFQVGFSFNNGLIKHNTGNCDCCGQETSEHVILHFQKYQVERQNLTLHFRNAKILLHITHTKFTLG